jgi:hypothetical protein
MVRVADGDLDRIFPNLKNFPVKRLGFVQGEAFVVVRLFDAIAQARSRRA